MYAENNLGKKVVIVEYYWLGLVESFYDIVLKDLVYQEMR